MDITVAVCTWNRAHLLRRTLESLRRLEVPAGTRWEVLVVDNASTDATPALLNEYRALLPLRVVREARQGTAHARNRAAREAAGAFLLCTDDDVEVDAAWLRAYVDAIAAHPQAELFGGTVLPRFEGRPPRWLRSGWSLVSGAYAARELGTHGFDLEACIAHLPYGPSYAVRTALARRFPCDIGLGPNGAQRNVGDETTALSQMLLAGARGRWVPQARAWHWVSRERQTVAFVAEHFRLAARAPLPLQPPARPKSAEKLRRAAARHRRRYWLARALLRPAPVWLEHLRAAQRARGRLDALGPPAAAPVAA